LINYKKRSANKLNAQKSTGPKTPDGKSASSKNAVKHGLLAKCALMPADDESEYEALQAMLRDEFLPIGDYEETLIDDLANAFWRLRRLLQMEGQILVYARYSVKHSVASGKVSDVEWASSGLDEMLGMSAQSSIKDLKDKKAAIKAKVAQAEDSWGGAFLYNIKNGDPLAKLARHETRIRNEIRKIVAELTDRQGKPSKPKTVNPDGGAKSLNGEPKVSQPDGQ
jgi:hypothetical protein